MPASRPSGFRKLDALFRRAVEPVFLLDADGKFAYVNPAWEALAGRPADSVLGRVPASSDPGEAAGVPLDTFAPPAETFKAQPSGGSLLVPRGGGTADRMRVEFFPFRAPDDSLLGILGTIRRESDSSPLPTSPALEARAALADARQALIARYGAAKLIGRGPSHERLLDQVATAAQVRSPASIVGEPGTGKKLVARLIHEQGRESLAPLIALDVAALPARDLERLLLEGDGYASEKPATIVLGDISALPRDIQARLTREIRRPDFPRLLMTSSTEPDVAFRDGRLREDFFFAITALVIRTAPLRERHDEIPLIAQDILERPGRRVDLSADALEVLLSYDWPGNVRELARVIDSAREVATGREIAAADLPACIRGEMASAYAPPQLTAATTPLDDWLARVERRLIQAALRNARDNKSRAAELLEISRPRLHRRIKELGIDDAEKAEDSG